MNTLLSTRSDTPEMMTWLNAGSWAAAALGEDDALFRLSRRLEKMARAQGAVVALSNAVFLSGVSDLFAGALDDAQAHFIERGAIESARGGSCELGKLIVSAWRGRCSELRANALDVVRVATEQTQGWKLVCVEYGLALAAVGSGHYREALDQVSGDFEGNPLLTTFALPDLVEAAARSGHTSRAAALVDSIAHRTAASPTPLTLGLLARCRALIADEADAEALLRESIDHLSAARGVAHVARSQLLYGEWLRRVKRRREAREQLRSALKAFEDMEADGFAERARRELLATGETARRRRVEAEQELTPQETQVASLAALGATNREIAAQLFISPKTVDYHLGKVLGKLGIASRRQLARTAPRGA